MIRVHVFTSPNRHLDIALSRWSWFPYLDPAIRVPILVPYLDPIGIGTHNGSRYPYSPLGQYVNLTVIGTHLTPVLDTQSGCHLIPHLEPHLGYPIRYPNLGAQMGTPWVPHEVPMGLPIWSYCRNIAQSAQYGQNRHIWPKPPYWPNSALWARNGQ